MVDFQKGQEITFAVFSKTMAALKTVLVLQTYYILTSFNFSCEWVNCSNK